MRAGLQLSFEFLIYTALSIAALAVATGLFVYSSQASSAVSSREYLEQLAALLNSNMGYQHSTFYAFVPRAVCNSSVAGTEISSRFGNFSLNGRVSVPAGMLCGVSGKVDRLNMSRQYNGTYYITVSG